MQDKIPGTAYYTRADRPVWSTQDSTARFAGAALRRPCAAVCKLGIGSCIHPGRRASARRADLDHTHGPPSAEPPPTPIPARCAGTTTSSRPPAGGGYTNPKPATSPGSAHRGGPPHPTPAYHS